MLTRIVRPSPALDTFLQPLTAHLSQPQRQHLLELADALLVCEDRKTLAALQRQFLDATDPSNWADFLRVSPWSADLVRDALRRGHLAWLLDEAQRRGLPKVLFLNLDDSLGKKDRQTCRLEPVDWFHDHNESTPQRPRYHKAFCYLECTARVGGLTATLDLRLYLRAKTVRRLNRHRAAGQRLSFRSKNTLACAMLKALKPLLPTSPVSVRFFVQSGVAVSGCAASSGRIVLARCASGGGSRCGDGARRDGTPGLGSRSPRSAPALAALSKRASVFFPRLASCVRNQVATSDRA